MKTELEKFSAMSARSLDILQNIAKQRKSSSKREQQNLVAETEAHFSFLSGVSPGKDLVVDSGATSNMIKDRDMFVSLDENFKGLVSNANFSESKILGKGEVRPRVKEKKGELKMIELKDTLYVPENSRIVLSV